MPSAPFDAVVTCDGNIPFVRNFEDGTSKTQSYDVEPFGTIYIKILNHRIEMPNFEITVWRGEELFFNLEQNIETGFVFWMEELFVLSDGLKNIKAEIRQMVGNNPYYTIYLKFRPR
jgi:hypothetical protein